MAACAPSRPAHTITGPERPPLPVIRWLRMGAVAAGVGMALAAAPAIAAADDGAATSASDSAGSAPSRSAGAVAGDQRSPGAATAARRAGAVRTEGVRTEAGRSLTRQLTPPAPAAARDRLPDVSPVAQTAASTPAAQSIESTPSAAAVAGPTAELPIAPVGQLAAFLGLPGAPATSAPSLGAIPILLRLTLEDLLSGTGPAVVTNPTAVVTGLFNQVLRTDPTEEELQNYLGVFNFTGVNGVVAGLYSSTLFRQTEVENYYLELLGRKPTDLELSWGTAQLMWGMPEPLFAGSIAGSSEFYQASAAGGGSAGAQPSATAFVDNLYRSLLGTTAYPAVASQYIQQIQSGVPIELAAMQFVTADAFRQVKVQEVYSVLGQTASQAAVSAAVQTWLLSGGLAGIATSLLAAAANVQRIEAGLVTLPDIASAAQLEQLLLAPYTDAQDGFVKLFNQLLGVSETSTCPTSPTCNVELYLLLTTGGSSRGLPNTALTVTYQNSSVANLIPTQNEIDLSRSLRFPLRDPVQLATYFAGGVIEPFGNPVMTSDDGTYIVDGHHRWSGIYLINPFTEVKSVDLGYVPRPQTGLVEAQVGVATELGYLKVSTGGGINVYTCDRATFDAAIADYINNNPDPVKEAQVYDVFTENLKLTGTDPQKLVGIQNYLWTNVLRMRTYNPFVPGAPSRNVMPQADDLKPILAYLGSGQLSYSFPVISYLG